MDKHPLAVRGTKSEDRWSQSRHEIWSPLPVKQITCSVSGAGKSSVIQAAVSALFDHFDYFAVYSHSHTLDPSYQELKDKIREKYLRTGIDPELNPVFFDNLEGLPRVLAAQRDRVQEQKDADPPVRRLVQLCVVVDDMLHETAHSKVLDNLYARGRHFGCSVFAGSQLYRGLSGAIRKNADVLTIHRLPAREYQAVEEELAGTWVTKEQRRELYEMAVGAHPYGFLTVRLKSKDPTRMSYSDYSRRLLPH